MKHYHIWFQTKFKKYMLVDDIDSRIHVTFGRENMLLKKLRRKGYKRLPVIFVTKRRIYMLPNSPHFSVGFTHSPWRRAEK